MAQGLNVNLQSMTIEQVLAVRRKQCVAMAGNMEVELKKCGAHKFVVQCIASHREVIEKREHRF